MTIIKRKSGLGLPMVIGIILFIVTSTIILVTSIYSQSLMVEADYKNHEEYLNAQSLIDATDQIIARDQNLDSTYLAALSAHMKVNISEYSSDIYLISKTLSNNEIVKSYLMTHNTSSTTTINLVDSLFQYSGIENDFELNPFIQPARILSKYLEQFMDNSFPSLNYDEDFDNFDDIFNYFHNLASQGTTYQLIKSSVLKNQSNPTVNGHWYINGNVKIENYKNLTIPEGYLLFIDGDLQMGKNSTIYGNLVVNGNVKFVSKNKKATLQGTIYNSGKITTDNNFYLGTAQRPSFIFSDKTITLKTKVIGYGYFLSQSFSVRKRRTTIDIIGGIYSSSISNIDNTELEIYSGLDINLFYSYAVPETITVSTNNSQSGNYAYTYPT